MATETAGVELKTFVLSHAIWVVAIVVALVVGHVALQEHDARVVAEAAVKVSEANVSNLQSKIKFTDAAAAQRQQVIVKIVHDVQTPQQAVVAVPQLTDIPLNARLIPNNAVDVQVAALPLIQLLGQFKSDQVALAACQSDLTNTNGIVVQKQAEIAALKKKPSLMHRVESVAKAVGIGVAIGLVLGAHGL